MDMTAVLCYVERDWAYFTTQHLAEQWGDDWNDAPYDCNAGLPYRYLSEHDQGEPWTVIKVGWEGPFEAPNAWKVNSRYSVQDINRGAVPWLVAERYGQAHGVTIPAGLSLGAFIAAVQSVGGAIWMPLT